jgi:hypothetical protein
MTAAIQDYYSDQDFDRTDAILDRARQCELTDVQQRLVDRLILANQHHRLTFATMRAVAVGDTVSALEAADGLMEFRIGHRDDLTMNWPNLFRQQAEVCGVDTRVLAETYRFLTREGRALTEVLATARNRVDNGGFEDGWTSWTRSRWHAQSARAREPYDREAETTIAEGGAIEGSRFVLVDVKPENREFVYSIRQGLPVRPGTAYLFRFAWKRDTVEAEVEPRGLEDPRFRLRFLDDSGKLTSYGATGASALWGGMGDQRLDTDWARVSRIIRIDPDSPVRTVDITFFFSSWSRNMIDDVEWLELW